jgi:hypothetical protein
VARFIPAIPGYIYATTEDELYVNLYLTNSARFEMGGREVQISQEADYPWDGNVGVMIDENNAGKFAMKVRLPGWALNEAIPGELYRFDDDVNEPVIIKLNGKSVRYSTQDGYAVINRNWKRGDRLDILLPMPVRTVRADERVKDNTGKIAVQRGPLMFCAEGPDNSDGHVLNYVIDKEAGFVSEYVPTLLQGTQIVKAKGSRVRRDIDGSVHTGEVEELVLIPYHLWNNRGSAEMMVWLPVTLENAKPMAAPTIANRSNITASKPTRALQSIKDQYEPENSNDHSWPYYHWWPDNNKWEWIQYDFEKPEKVSETMIYWFDDGPFGGCRIPAEWRIEYLSGGTWKPVENVGEYTVTKDGWDTLKFKAVTTTGLRLYVKLPARHSSGVHEWVVN